MAARTLAIALLISACCTEEHCDRAEVIAAIRDLAEGTIDDCGINSERSDAEILACIDEAMQNDRGYLYTRRGDFEYTFVATAQAEHWLIAVEPERMGAERFLCPVLDTSGTLPDCDWSQYVRDIYICSYNECGIAVAGH